jgi:hypothetical protein
VSETLFDGYEPAQPLPDPMEGMSADRRRTLRQAANVAAGIHPLTKGALHPLASRHRDADSPKDDPYTCGTCWFREVLRYHDRSFPKCCLPGPERVYRKGEDGEWRWETNDHGAPRATHSAASDVRAWWPACPDYSPSDRVSSDAARYVPPTPEETR